MSTVYIGYLVYSWEYGLVGRDAFQTWHRPIGHYTRSIVISKGVQHAFGHTELFQSIFQSVLVRVVIVLFAKTIKAIHFIVSLWFAHAFACDCEGRARYVLKALWNIFSKQESGLALAFCEPSGLRISC